MKELSREELLKNYEFVSSFVKGLAQVIKDGKQFHIRPDGTPVYEERYDFVSSFSEGLAWVTKDGRGFYIHPDGTRAD